ncbi:hypothetical protein C1H46_038762 [Malus baccata]|uniref:Uncharacterized protein n=1 Tax=Malus baccata TaxID=106549 RepID=A0A540KND6_MALBA|nr:hypothetical protein C1H46_038762 [Malus baccata]
MGVWVYRQRYGLHRDERISPPPLSLPTLSLSLSGSKKNEEDEEGNLRLPRDLRLGFRRGILICERRCVLGKRKKRMDSVPSNSHANLDEQIAQLMQCKSLSEQEVSWVAVEHQSTSLSNTHSLEPTFYAGFLKYLLFCY